MDVDSETQERPAAVVKTPYWLPEDDPFDLDQVASQYEGRSKLTRLYFIANMCPSLSGQAFTLALATLRESTLDFAMYETTFTHYRQIVNHLQSGDNKDPVAQAWYSSIKGKEVPIDRAWMDRARREARSGQDKLEVELKGYTTNLIKESIRMGHRDLARFLYRCGDLQGAIRSYTKSREFCTTSQHVLEMCLGVIEVALELNNYAFVRNYVVKAETALEAIATSTQNGKAKVAPTNMPGMIAPGMDPVEAAKEKERLTTQERLTVANGVALLGSGDFARAARAFTGVGKETLSSQTTHFIPPADIALYAVFTGLATFSRNELRRKVLENADLRPMLDLEPYLRDIVRAFYDSKYREGLELLHKYSARPALDSHLSPHVPRLIYLIQSRALLVYFRPYSNVALPRMAAAFGYSEPELRRHVEKLIGSGDLKARIDNQAGVLVARRKDVRAEAFKKALEEGEKIARRAVAADLRMKLIQAEVLVKGPKNAQETY